MRPLLPILLLTVACEPARELVYHGGRVNLLNTKPAEWETHPAANGGVVRVYDSAGTQTDETESDDAWFSTEVLSFDYYAVVLEGPDDDPDWITTATSAWSFGDDNENLDYALVTTVLDPDWQVEPFRDCLVPTSRFIVGTARLYDPTGDRPPGADDDWEPEDGPRYDPLQLPTHQVRVAAVDGGPPTGDLCERAAAFRVGPVEPGWHTLTLESTQLGTQHDFRVYVPDDGIALLRAAVISARWDQP